MCFIIGSMFIIFRYIFFIVFWILVFFDYLCIYFIDLFLYCFGYSNFLIICFEIFSEIVDLVGFCLRYILYI